MNNSFPNKEDVEALYPNLKDDDFIEEFAIISSKNGKKQVEIIDTLYKNKEGILKLSNDIGHITASYNKINTMFEFIVGDFSEIIKYRNSVIKDDAKARDNSLNRFLVHLLSSGKLFTDFLENHFKDKYGKKSVEFNKFKSILSKAYDENFVYRFFYSLRNFTQHIGFPVTSLSSGIVYNQEKEAEEIETFALLEIDYLLNSNYDWKKIVKEDLLRLKKENSNLEMFSLSAEYYKIMSQVMFKTKELFLDLNHSKMLTLLERSDKLGLEAYPYALAKITKYNLIHNPTNLTLNPISSRYDLERIYLDLSKIGLVNIINPKDNNDS